MGLTEREEEAAREMFMTSGWSAFIEQIEDQAELCNLDACSTLEDLWFNKGRLAVLRMLINYESYVKNLGEEESELDPIYQ